MLPYCAARSWKTFPMDVFAVGRAPKPVTTPRTIVGVSLTSPGTCLAISSRPTLLRVPDFLLTVPPLSPLLLLCASP